MKVHYQFNSETSWLYFGLAFLVSFLLLPLFALAAASDALLQDGTEIVANGETLTIADSGVESLTVNDGNFTVDMPNGSAIKVTSANKRTFTVSPDSRVESFECGGSSSILLVKGPPSGSATVTVTITPADSGTCGGGGGGSAGAGAAGGGGGGGGYVAPKKVAVATPAAAAPVLGVAVGLTTNQAQSILDLLASFNADKSILDAVRNVFLGKATAGAVSAPAGAASSITRGLSAGSKGADVKKLQQLLNSDMDTRVAASGAGSPGNESEYFGSLTAKAVQKFQVKYKLAGPGDAGYGFVGPKTRAKLTEIFGE